MGPANDVLQLGRHKRVDDRDMWAAFTRNPTEFFVFGEPIFRQESTDLVPGEQFHCPGAISHGNAHPVRVRIGRDHEVGPPPIRQRHSERERFGVLRIRRLHRRKARIKL